MPPKPAPAKTTAKKATAPAKTTATKKTTTAAKPAAKSDAKTAPTAAPTAAPAAAAAAPAPKKIEGVTIGLKALATTLDDATKKIEESGRAVLILDKTGNAATFLKYRDVNYLMAAHERDLMPETLRMALLGACRFGKPAAIDLMDSDLYHILVARMNEVDAGLMDCLLNNEFVKTQRYLKLIRDSDPNEYSENEFWKNEPILDRFQFILISTSETPDENMLCRMYPVRVE